MARLRKLDLGRLSILAVILLGTVAMVTKDQWDWVFASDEAEEQGVSAETIDDVDDATERLYRVAPNNGSQVSYAVEERLAGSEGQAVGVTTVVAGDIVINTEDPTQSRIGEVVVNVEMFDSDSNLRDKRLRHDFLESNHFPFARFETTSIDGLDAEFADGSTYDIALTGDLTVKETTSEETFSGTVTVDGDQLTADVSAVVLSSTYGVGPINVARLAHTADEVTLSFSLVADRVELGTDADPDLDTDVPEFAVAGGAFAAEVQPILEQNCVSCHTTGGPGWETLAFDTAADAAEIADDIALVTEIRFMPPWLPGGDSPEFEHSWELTDDEIATLRTWADDGGGLDVPPDTPLVAGDPAIIPIEEDQIIDPRDGKYPPLLDDAGEPVLKDDYRCQVHEVADPEGDGTWIKGYEFRPDVTTVVHHSIIYLAPPEALDEIAVKSAEDDRPGWTCFGTSNLRTDGVRNMGGWAPGQAPTTYPDGYGLFIPPGYVVINQTHYHFDHAAEADGSQIILDEATDQQMVGITSVAGSSYLTPAEVPCTPEEEAIAAEREATIDGYRNLCIRENVLEEIGEKYDVFATFIPNALILGCGGTVDDYDDLDGSIGHSSCDMQARNPGTIYTVLGHMHEFGDAYKMTLNPDTPEEMVLLDIPNWDFEWQLNYDLVEDVRIDRSDVIRFECWWDRTRMYMPEPRYITWNEGTVDEMCFSSVSVLPDKPDAE
ncbi:MAG: YceI family protein [Acidimicrobiales bacterium]